MEGIALKSTAKDFAMIIVSIIQGLYVHIHVSFTKFTMKTYQPSKGGPRYTIETSVFP